MKRKKYKVSVKLICNTTIDHEQTSMKKAKDDVSNLIDNYIKQGLDLKQIFDSKPEFTYKVEKYNG